MPKGSSAQDPRRPVFLDLLVDARKKAGFTQAQLAMARGVSQPYVSQVESGFIRLDGLQLRDWLNACGSDLGRFGSALELRPASRAVSISGDPGVEAVVVRATNDEEASAGGRALPGSPDEELGRDGPMDASGLIRAVYPAARLGVTGQ